LLASLAGGDLWMEGEPSMTVSEWTVGPVSIGIDAGVVAAHQVAVRGPGIRQDFRVPPTLAGMAELTERLRAHAGSLVVAEPTAGTWLPLSVAVSAAGCRVGFVANRDSARLRAAIAGANKTDVIDATVLAGCEQILGVRPSLPVGFGQIGLRRAMSRRHAVTVAAHRAECRLWALSAWAFPDLWRACGGHRLAQPVLRRWAHLGAPSGAHLDTLAEVVAAHRRDRQPARRAEGIRAAARGWLAFWAGQLDPDALAWEVCELLDDIDDADVTIARAASHAMVVWRTYWPDDVLVSVPRIGPVCAAATRAWWGSASQFPTAKDAAAFVGLNPSNWESGLSASPSRPITETGPPELRLAYDQAGNVARRHDPALAAHDRKLMVERNHTHIQATTAIARKLAWRAWAVLHTGQPYHLRDLDGHPIDQAAATAIAATLAVPEQVRQRRRAHLSRGRLSL
jgi:transposase